MWELAGVPPIAEYEERGSIILDTAQRAITYAQWNRLWVWVRKLLASHELMNDGPYGDGNRITDKDVNMVPHSPSFTHAYAILP